MSLEIKTMFSRIAKRYDLTNTVLSTGLHKYWNKKLVKDVLTHFPKGGTYLDLCSGTGAIGFCYLKQAEKCGKSPSSLYFLDFCEEMLVIAKQHAPSTSSHITFIVADAKSIPLGNSSCDSVTMAYGIRNIDDPKKSFHEMARILKPGGIAGILELTRPKVPLLRAVHKIWLRFCLPLLGALVTGDKKAYHYLKNSIQTFLEPSALIELAKEEGLVPIKATSLTGGIATLLIFQKLGTKRSVIPNKVV